MKILVVSPNYPNKGSDTFTFVKQLVDEFSRSGHKCRVISPYGYHPKELFLSHKTIYEIDGYVEIVRPPFMLFPLFFISGLALSQLIRRYSVLKETKTMDFVPDVIYCHFWSSGYEIYKYAVKNNIPLFVATGESVITNLFRPSRFTRKFSNYVKGVICVSSKNKNESIKLGLTTSDKCIIIPNAIDNNIFHLSNETKLKNKLGIKSDDFVVAFVGWFIERKGSKRLSDAIKRISDEHVKSIFIGKGPDEPDCPGIIYKGPVNHELIYEYLNCANIFVLPTQYEGCSNAIVEAMACGLPIVSSNRDFNLDILDNTNSILIDPNNIDEIAFAIMQLKDNKKQCEFLRSGALLKSKELRIDIRAKRIIDFIKSKV